MQRNRRQEGGLIAGRTAAEVGTGEVLPRVFQRVVRQHSIEAGSGKHPLRVVHGTAIARPAQSADRSQRIGAAGGERIEKLEQRLLSLAPHGIVDVGRIDGRLGTDGRESTPPDDRHVGGLRADRFRDGDRRGELRPAHDGNSDCGHRLGGLVSDDTYRPLDEVALDVAIEDLRVMFVAQRCGQAQHRQGKARVALRRDGRIDEQNPPCLAHESLSAGTSQRISSISSGQRYSSRLQR